MTDTGELEAQLAATSDRKTRIDLLNDLAWKLRRSDPARCRALCTEARELASSGIYKEALYRDGLGYSLLILSVLEWDVANYELAMPLGAEALSLFEQTGNTYRQACALSHLAGIHFFLGNYPQALEMALDALSMSEHLPDRNLKGSLLNNIGYLYLHLERFPDALPQLLKAVELHRATGMKASEADALDSVSRAYLLMKDFARALEYDRRSLALVREVGYRRGEAEILVHIGRIHRAAGDLDQALAHFQQALAIASEHDHKQFIAEALTGIGQVHILRGDTSEALAALDRALAVADAIKSKQLVFAIHESLADAHEQAGDTAQALAHYKQFHAAKEEVFNEKSEHQLRSLQLAYDLESTKKVADIYRQKSTELEQEVLEREKLIAELNAFARTVAHDLKNPLAVIAGHAEIILDYLQNGGGAFDPAELAQTVVTMSYKTSRIIDELLLLASVRQEDVQPEPVNIARVVASVEQRLASTIREHHATIHKPDAWPEALGHAPWIEEIWANYISNAIKYGGSPPMVELGATPDGTHVRFWVRDNGDGIRADEQARMFAEFTRLRPHRAEGHGLGLSIVKRIVEKLGGEVAVSSPGLPGQGSTFSFTLPRVD